MKKNIGSADKIVRILLGIIIAVLGFVFQSWWGLVALVPILTALVGVCPAYLTFGLSTIGKKNESKTQSV